MQSRERVKLGENVQVINASAALSLFLSWRGFNKRKSCERADEMTTILFLGQSLTLKPTKKHAKVRLLVAAFPFLHRMTWHPSRRKTKRPLSESQNSYCICNSGFYLTVRITIQCYPRNTSGREWPHMAHSSFWRCVKREMRWLLTKMTFSSTSSLRQSSSSRKSTAARLAWPSSEAFFSAASTGAASSSTST